MNRTNHPTKQHEQVIYTCLIRVNLNDDDDDGVLTSRTTQLMHISHGQGEGEQIGVNRWKKSNN